MQDQPIAQSIPKTNRPRSVAIAGWLHVVQSLGLLGYGVHRVLAFDWEPGGTIDFSHYTPLVLFDKMSSGVVSIFLAVFTLTVALALLWMRRWAWLAAVTLQGLGLLAAIIGYMRQQPNYLGMLLGIILIFYLNQQEVQAAFREKRRPV